LNHRNNWQVNAPAISGLTVILLLAPSSPTQPKAHHALVASIAGLSVLAAGYGIAVNGHPPGTPYNAAAFLIVTAAAFAGCIEFTALTHLGHWTGTTRATSAVGVAGKENGGNVTDANATESAGIPPADT
jgi:hypothetical protein